MLGIYSIVIFIVWVDQSKLVIVHSSCVVRPHWSTRSMFSLNFRKSATQYRNLQLKRPSNIVYPSHSLQTNCVFFGLGHCDGSHALLQLLLKDIWLRNLNERRVWTAYRTKAIRWFIMWRRWRCHGVSMKGRRNRKSDNPANRRSPRGRGVSFVSALRGLC